MGLFILVGLQKSLEEEFLLRRSWSFCFLSCILNRDGERKDIRVLLLAKLHSCFAGDESIGYQLGFYVSTLRQRVDRGTT